MGSQEVLAPPPPTWASLGRAEQDEVRRGRGRDGGVRGQAAASEAVVREWDPGGQLGLSAGCQGPGCGRPEGSGGESHR